MYGWYAVSNTWDVFMRGNELRSGKLCYVLPMGNSNGLYGPTECRLIEPSEDLDKQHERHEWPDDFPPFHYRMISVPYHRLVCVVNDLDRKGDSDGLVTVQFLGGPYCGRWGQIARGKLQ